jgi:hypothetical protein
MCFTFRNITWRKDTIIQLKSVRELVYVYLIIMQKCPSISTSINLSVSSVWACNPNHIHVLHFSSQQRTFTFVLKQSNKLNYHIYIYIYIYIYILLHDNNQLVAKIQVILLFHSLKAQFHMNETSTCQFPKFWSVCSACIPNIMHKWWKLLPCVSSTV